MGGEARRDRPHAATQRRGSGSSAGAGRCESRTGERFPTSASAFSWGVRVEPGRSAKPTSPAAARQLNGAGSVEPGTTEAVVRRPRGLVPAPGPRGRSRGASTVTCELRRASPTPWLQIRGQQDALGELLVRRSDELQLAAPARARRPSSTTWSSTRWPTSRSTTTRDGFWSLLASSLSGALGDHERWLRRYGQGPAARLSASNGYSQRNPRTASRRPPAAQQRDHCSEPRRCGEGSHRRRSPPRGRRSGA